MPLLGNEPSGTVETMEELFAIAAAMEQEAIAGYASLADRMRREGRPDLAAVFEKLVEEESGHLGNVGYWSQRTTGKEPDPSAVRWSLDPTFDDEGASLVAPELLGAYRVFSIAVRNEERAFAFWTYLASRSPSAPLREAAEQMAREELSHIATLRQERRRAFHLQREAISGRAQQWTLVAFEEHLSTLLAARAVEDVPGSAGATLAGLSAQASARAKALTHHPLSPALVSLDPAVLEAPRALSEALLDAYLDLAERLPDEAGRARAQTYAARILDCISALRTGR